MSSNSRYPALRQGLLVLALCISGLAGCSRNDQAGHCEPPSSAPARQVVIVGIDGLRADALGPSLTPFLFQLAQSPGVSAGTVDVSNGRTQQTFSAPGWITVLTGRWAREHGILDNDSAGPIKAETLFERVEEDMPGSRSLLVTQWKRLYELVRQRLDTRSGLHHATVLRADDAAIEQEVLGTWRSCQPQLAFIHLDAVDQAGHRGAFDVGDAGYAAAVRETDGRLRRLWESALNVSSGPEQLVIFVSDHGGMGNGHGRYSEAERMAPVLVVMPAGHSAVGVRDLVGVGRVALEFLRGG